jgi:hypothetical protein
MKWKCSEGYKWESTCCHVKNHGHWCGICGKTNLSEEMCREIIEDLLLEKFPSVYPKWLERLELYGYNEKLNIAFEYNGIQHYKYVPEFFHKNGIHLFETQKKNDLKKYKICRERNINLIIIPYQYTYQEPIELRNFIFAELNKIC